MKKIFVTVLFLILFLASNQAFASKLPENEIKALSKTFTDMKVRFDGLIELSDGTQYVPVFPIQSVKQNPTKVVMTLPKDKPLKQKPDFFMFNTNLAFFKIIKKEDGKTTFAYSDEIPMDIKMGLLPQDLLVPTGFEMPGELRIIVGDLVMPVLPPKEFKEVNLVTNKEVTNSPRTQLVEQAAQQVANKYFYTTSFNLNTVNVLNADNGQAFKQIQFSSIPSDIKLSNEGKYLLVSTIKNGNVFVVDALKAQVLKELKVGSKPSFITVSDSENLAYVANRGAKAISVIDLISMETKEDIPVKGNPTYIEVVDDGLTLYYLDAINGIVYSLTKQDNELEPFTIKPLFRTNNVSKIQYANKKIYTLDRGKNELDIFYIKGKPLKEGAVNSFDITPVEEENPEQTEVNVEDEKVAEVDKEEIAVADNSADKAEEVVAVEENATPAEEKAEDKEDDVDIFDDPNNPFNRGVIDINKDKIYPLLDEKQMNQKGNVKKEEKLAEQETTAEVKEENETANVVEEDTSIAEENPITETETTEKVSFKDKTKKFFRSVLYYKEDDLADTAALNPENQVVVFARNLEEYEKEEIPEEETKKSFLQNAKEKFLDYMMYTPVTEEESPIEKLQSAVEKQMDFIKLDTRANDFVIVDEKLYLLCSDSYTIQVYDVNTLKNINTIKLDEVGYYNSIKISKDKTTGILTNITSKELVLFDVKSDKVIQKLPVSVNVHNVVITGK